MKRKICISVLISILMILLVILSVAYHPTNEEAHGSLRIPSDEINDSVSITGHGDACGCTDALWNGGQARTDADMHRVSIGATAYLTTECGTHYVLECVSIDRCVTIGEWLVGWRGIIRADGDVLIVSGNWVYRFTRL